MRTEKQILGLANTGLDWCEGECELEIDEEGEAILVMRSIARTGYRKKTDGLFHQEECECDACVEEVSQ